MEIRHLKLVKAVHEEGSLTSAGKRLFLSQSALSHQLRELEEHLGTTVFQRANKKMVLTQAGNRILEAANRVLLELEKTQNDVQRFSDGDAGLLRISTECYTCYHWLPSLLKTYHKLFPSVDVRIVAEGTRQPKNFLKEGRLEVAIVSCLTPRDDHGYFKFTELFKDEKVVVVNVEHPFAKQESVSPQQFADEHLLCYTAPKEMLDIFQRVLIPLGITPKKVSKIQLTEAIIEMIQADLGISVMAKWAVKPYLKSKKLVAVPVENHLLSRIWYAVTMTDRKAPRYIECFVQHMKEHPIA